MAIKKKSKKKSAPLASAVGESCNNGQLDNSYGSLLVKKTLRRRPTYRYILSAADIGKLAPHYQLLLEPDDTFNVVGSKKQLGQLLDAYRDNNRKGVLSLILHVAPLHWAAMIVNGRKVYFADSLDYEMLSEYDEALKERPELHLSNYSWKQQDDAHNCGFWALMNAEAIRRQIHNYVPNSECFPCVLPSISLEWQVRFFAALRRDMAKKVKENDTDGDDRLVVKQEEEEDEPSNSPETVPSVKTPATVQQRKMKAHEKAVPPKKKPADNSPVHVVDRKKSGKRKKEVKDESSKKKRKVETEEVPNGTSKNVDTTSHVCDICSHLFSTRKLLLLHSRYHRPRNIKCEYCEYATNYEWNLEQHVKKMHLDAVKRRGGIHACPKCKKEYTRPNLLERHKCLL